MDLSRTAYVRLFVLNWAVAYRTFTPVWNEDEENTQFMGRISEPSFSKPRGSHTQK